MKDTFGLAMTGPFGACADRVVVSQCLEQPEFEERSVTALAREQGVDPVDFMPRARVGPTHAQGQDVVDPTVSCRSGVFQPYQPERGFNAADYRATSLRPLTVRP